MERELPRDFKSETEVISSILYNPKNLTSVIELLDPADFYNSGLKIIYETMLELFAEDSPIEVTAIAHKLGAEGLKRIGGVSHLTELLTSGYSVNFEYYCKIIKDKSRRRALIKSCNLAQAKAYDEQIDVSEVINGFQDGILDKRSKSSIKSNADLLGKTIEAIEERFKNGGGIPGMKTGFSCFNKSTNGLKKGELVVIAGRPSMGKTLIALHLADGLSENGNKVGLFEMEMSEESLGTRRIAYKARIEASKLQRGEISPQEWERIAEAYNKVSKNDNLFTDCSEDNSVIDIKAKAKILKQQKGLDVIIVDHLTLLNIKNTGNRSNDIAEVTRQFKKMAKELDICVIILSQLNRANEARSDKRPVLSDLRESGAIEQDADLVLFAHREEYYNPETENKGTMEWIIAKQRNGSVGTLIFDYHAKYQMILERFRR